FLDDRTGVRTPMQWSGDCNAGFSRADSQRLYAPVITDPVYGYQVVNVDSQERDRASLLWWMKRMLALRKQHKRSEEGRVGTGGQTVALPMFCLDDRTGVRTPMQGSGDCNAGFSRADSQRLYAPVITDPVYGYQVVNVDSQERDRASLLWWMKRMLALRKQHK